MRQVDKWLLRNAEFDPRDPGDPLSASNGPDPDPLSASNGPDPDPLSACNGPASDPSESILMARAVSEGVFFEGDSPNFFFELEAENFRDGWH